MISTYEAGQRQSALSTLAALVAATGLELDVRVRRRRWGLNRLRGPRGRQVRRHRRRLVPTAAEHGVTNLRVFGSVARGEDDPDSDIDLLATIQEGMGLIGLGRLREELETVLGAGVDLVPDSDLKAGVARLVAQILVPATYRDEQRLLDIAAAIDAIRQHVAYGSLSEGWCSTRSGSDCWRSVRR